MPDPAVQRSDLLCTCKQILAREELFDLLCTCKQIMAREELIDLLCTCKQIMLCECVGITSPRS